MADFGNHLNGKDVEPGVVEAGFTIAMKANTGGIDATKTVLPYGITAAYTSPGVITLTVAQKYYGLYSGKVDIVNSGSWLAAFYVQFSQALPFSLSSANSTIVIHVGNATALADPASAYGVTGTLRFRNTSVGA